MRYYTRRNTLLKDNRLQRHIIPQGTECRILNSTDNPADRNHPDVSDRVQVTLVDGKILVGFIKCKDIAIDFSNPEEEEIQNVIERGF